VGVGVGPDQGGPGEAPRLSEERRISALLEKCHCFSEKRQSPEFWHRRGSAREAPFTSIFPASRFCRETPRLGASLPSRRSTKVGASPGEKRLLRQPRSANTRWGEAPFEGRQERQDVTPRRTTTSLHLVKILGATQSGGPGLTRFIR
jgi:hypothetical protein